MTRHARLFWPASTLRKVPP